MIGFGGIKIMINRLKEISMKDTLSLDDREYLKNLSKAENEGRFIEIPCKVGDIVYVDKDTMHLGCLNWKRFMYPQYIKSEVINLRITRAQKLIKIKPLIEENINFRNYDFFSFASIGKTVFLTRQDNERI
jgi:hypothetical protein